MIRARRLPAGAWCTVKETDKGQADCTPEPITVTVKADETVMVRFTGGSANRFSSGTVGVIKELAGAAADEDWAAKPTFDLGQVSTRGN